MPEAARELLCFSKWNLDQARRLPLLAIALTLLVSALTTGAPALARQGEVFYVDGNSAVNGTGTELSPFNTLTAVPAIEDSEVYVAGTLREAVQWSGVRRGTVVQQWAGKPQAELRGDVIAPPDEWTRQDNGVFSTAIPSPPSSVVWNWDTNVDSQGRHFGHLRGVASLAECRSAAATWFFDQGMATLYLHPPAGAQSPDIGDVYAWVRTGCGFTLSQCEDLTIDGLQFRLWTDPSSGNGYGIKFTSATNCTISNCLFEDCGYHSIGFIGSICERNQIISCVARGLHGRSIHFVFYSGGTDIVGCRATDCEAHLYNILDWQGDRLETQDTAGGYFTHTGSPAMIADVEFRRCVAIGYEGATGNSFGVGMTTTLAAEGRKAIEYPVRYVECDAVNCDYANVSGHVAFIRCRFDLRKAAISGGNSSSCFVFNRSGTQVAIESSEFITRLDGTNVSRAIWPKNPGDVLYLLGVTFYDEFPQAASRSFVRMGETGLVVAEQCVFASAAEMYLTNGASTNTPANFDFTNCWYFGIGPTWYSASPELNERSEWKALVDTSGWYNIDPNLIAPPEDLAPAPGGALWRVRVPLEGVTRLGISGKAYDGRLGAHQFGWPIARLAVSPCPLGGALQLMWSQATPGADVAILYSRRLGTGQIPPLRPCSGLHLDLAIPTAVLVGTLPSDSSGAGKLNAQVNPSVCGGYVQMVDLGGCTTTNVVPIR